MATSQFDVWEAAARMEFDDTEDVINVYQFQLVSAQALADSQGISDILEFLEAVYTIVRLTQQILITFRDIRLTNKTQDRAFGAFPWPTLVAGDEAQPPMVTGSAVLVNFATLTPGVQLRKYWGVMSEGSTDTEAKFNAATVTNLTPAVALLLEPYEATFGDWSYGHFSSVPVVPEFIIPIGGQVMTIPAYQRRRKVGRGS